VSVFYEPYNSSILIMAERGAKGEEAQFSSSSSRRRCDVPRGGDLDCRCELRMTRRASLVRSCFSASS
jgi:hypothetical protein